MAWGISSAATPGLKAVRFYPIPGAKDLNFVCQIQTEFPFIIATVTNAVISSGVTAGYP